MTTSIISYFALQPYQVWTIFMLFLISLFLFLVFSDEPPSNPGY